MKRTRGKSFTAELSNQIMSEVTRQCAAMLNKPIEYYDKHLEEVVNNVLHKKFEVDWDQISKRTGIQKRKCYKHFNETIAPKLASKGFDSSDEQFILE